MAGALASAEPQRGQSTSTTPLLSNRDRGSGPGNEGKKARHIDQRIDLALLPLLSLLYLFNGLDRGNIGNAQTQGFTDDIGAHPDDLNLAVSLFFVTFVLFQPVSAAIGWRLGPRRWIPIMMMCWGGITVAHAFIRGKCALIVARLLIGIFEAGFYPTAVMYLSLFYPPSKLGTRIGLFAGQYAVASAFSGAMAYGIFHIGFPGLKTWQVLFLVDGVLTCALAAVAWFALPEGPSTAWFLTEEQRELAVGRMHPDPDDGRGTEPIAARLSRRDWAETARDWKLWFVLAANICASVPVSAFSVFLPLVVRGMGYTAIEANLMSVPPAVCGAVGIYLFAASSDRRGERGLHIVAGLMVALCGLGAVLAVRSSWARYAALCLFLFGSSMSPPLTTAWLSANTPSLGKRVLVLGVNGWGNLAGVIGSQLFKAEHAPEYRQPLFATLAFLCAAVAGYVAYRGALKAANKRKAAIRISKSPDEIAAEELGTARVGDRKWTFEYEL